jgi:hypothetical protein
MALPTSGPLTLAQIQTEFGGSNPISLSEYYAGGAYVPSGTTGTNGAVPSSGAISIANFYGTAKSTRVSIGYTFSSSAANASLNLSAIGGYSAGQSDITITINSGVYLYATSTGNPGLNLTGGTTGDTLTIVNNGFIIGQGGTGGGYYQRDTPSPVTINNYLISNGGTALSIPINATIQNNSYIAGGGGGGGGPGITATGGGGAGGGPGGTKDSIVSGITGYTAGGVGGGIGANGGNGNLHSGGGTGGGGGRILPGTNITSTATVGSYTGTSTGGGANNAGASSTPTFGAAANNTAFVAGSGGSGGGAGAVYVGSGFYAQVAQSGGGGGGWGASGGPGRVNSNVINYSGASGGNCVALNGKTVTWSATGNRYGAIS